MKRATCAIQLSDFQIKYESYRYLTPHFGNTQTANANNYWQQQL